MEARNPIARVRPGRRTDFASIVKLDEDAVATIRALGVPVPQRDRRQFRAFFNHVLTKGTLRIGESREGVPLGYAAATYRQDWLHVEEVAVASPWRRRGLGAVLLEAIIREGTETGCAGITLTTDSDLPFNAPFYRRHGFDECEPGTCPEHLRSVLRSERARARFPHRRIGMVRIFGVAATDDGAAARSR